MQTRTMAAWVIIILMGLSTVGYAFLSSTSLTPSAPAQQTQETPTIVERALTPAELSLALRQGKVVFRSAHARSCVDCASADAQIEQFALQYSLFILFEKQVDPADNSTRLDAIGSSGRIVDLSNRTLDQAALLEEFCSLAPLQPRECILRNIDASTPAASPEPAATENRSTVSA